MKVYLITVIIAFALVFLMTVRNVVQERGCKKDEGKKYPSVIGTVFGSVIIALFWPIVLLAAIMICVADYWRAK